ncbi:MAG: hypothetical protein AAB840_01890 [Patescibacteria group bacterium]
MVASKEKSFDILDRYFTETPDEEIREDMRTYCPELEMDEHDGAPYLELVTEDPDPAEVTKMPSRWRRVIHLLFGR